MDTEIADAILSGDMVHIQSLFSKMRDINEVLDRIYISNFEASQK